MSRPTLDALRQRCPKPGAANLGNWMARRVARPLALHITWVVIPWGISAHSMTLAAMAVAIASAVAFGFGTVAGFLIGAALLQLWYLLDHVDGQLARFHGTASLDGVQLDYLMHHLVNIIVPVGVGWGLSVNHGQPAWALVGFIWGLTLLSVGLWHDCRYKAFVQRLKWVRGQLTVHGGGVPEPQPPIPTSFSRRCVWILRKLCEIHVVMNVLLVMSVVAWSFADSRLVLLTVTVVAMCAASGLVAVSSIAMSLRRQTAEQEFAAWYRLPPDDALVLRDGWWCVEPSEEVSSARCLKADDSVAAEVLAAQPRR